MSLTLTRASFSVLIASNRGWMLDAVELTSVCWLLLAEALPLDGGSRWKGRAGGGGGGAKDGEGCRTSPVDAILSSDKNYLHRIAFKQI